MNTNLSAGQAHIIEATLQMARDVLEREGFENASIQCKMALRTLKEAKGEQECLNR